MARKTTGSTTTTRRKTGTPSQPAAVQVASEVPSTAVPKEVRKNGKSAKAVPLHVPVSPVASLEEAIRRRAYELYLERRATAGSATGDENQDWLSAEREIRSRQGGQEQHTA